MLYMKRLEWGNCFSYGDTNSIDLDSANITQLIGENGSGKSSIALIIQEVLFNKNSKGVKKSDILNRDNGSNKYWITLYFDLGEDQYEIHVTRTSSLKVKLYKNGTDLSSHTATETFKSIEVIIGVDFKIFVQLMYQSMTDGLSFLTATDTVRKKFLIDLFNLDEYIAYFDIYKGLVQSTSKEITGLEGSITALTKIADKYKDIPEPMDKYLLPEKPEYPSGISDLEAKLINIEQVNKRIAQNEQLKKIHKSIFIDFEYLEKDITPTAPLNSRLGELKGSITHLKSFITKMNNLKDTCPTCGSDIDVSKEKKMKEEAEAELAKAQEAVTALSAEIEEVNKENELIRKNKKNFEEKNDLIQRIDLGLQPTPMDPEDLKYEISRLKKQYSRDTLEYEEIEKKNLHADQHNRKIEMHKEQLASTLEDIKEAEQSLQELQNKLSVYEILKKTFSTNGLVAFKLENLVKDIEESANQYLLELSDGRFSLSFEISGDKLNVSLNDGDHAIDISALSSGELARVNTSTLLAIRKIMSSISKTQINILFLDEVINVLDEYGKEKLIEVLLEEKSLNTFLVSHGWNHPLLAKIKVEKTDGVSQLREQ